MKKLDRELDTMAEEVFALPSAKPFREQYWSGEPSVIEEEVKIALRERRIRDEDQARAILIYLDQVGQNLRENFLQDNDTQVLSALMGDFEARSQNR